MGGEQSTDTKAQATSASKQQKTAVSPRKAMAAPSAPSPASAASAPSAPPDTASTASTAPNSATANGMNGILGMKDTAHTERKEEKAKEMEKEKEKEKEKENIMSVSDMESYFQSDFQVKIDPLIFETNTSIVQLRRYFHEIPELSFQEKKTSQAVAKWLKSRPLEVYENIAKTGVVAVLRGTGGAKGKGAPPTEGRCILLRADMDALPILETNDVSYKSKNVGNMHACGHDCHMAILLAVARMLTTREYCSRIDGTVKFCFQPAEEGLGGAKFMIDEGILERDDKNGIPRVDQVYGLHVWSYEKFGKCVVRDGPLMAGSDHFHISVIGLGGHGAEPKGTNDAIVAATQLILQFHTIISRNLSPLEEGVFTIGKLNSGDRGNIIAQTAQLDGTMRWFDEEVEKRLRGRVADIIAGVSRSFNVEIRIKWGDVKYPPTINDRQCTLNVEKAVSSVLPEGVIRSEPTMAAEDFSFFLNERPGSFFFLGCGVTDGTSNVYPHHKPDFKVDERCLVAGVQIMVNLVLDLLKPRQADPLVTEASNNESAKSSGN